MDDAVEQALRISSEVEDPVVIIFGSLSFIGPIIDRAEHGCYKKTIIMEVIWRLDGEMTKAPMQRIDNILKMRPTVSLWV